MDSRLGTTHNFPLATLEAGNLSIVAVGNLGETPIIHVNKKHGVACLGQGGARRVRTVFVHGGRGSGALNCSNDWEVSIPETKDSSPPPLLPPPPPPPPPLPPRIPPSPSPSPLPPSPPPRISAVRSNSLRMGRQYTCGAAPAFDLHDAFGGLEALIGLAEGRLILRCPRDRGPVTVRLGMSAAGRCGFDRCTDDGRPCAANRSVRVDPASNVAET